MAGDAPQPPRRIALSLPATQEGFAAGFDELRRGLDSLPLEPHVRSSVELIFEEVVANLVRHGARPDRRTTLSLELVLGEGDVHLTFVDDGVPFDPRGRADPSPPRDLEHAETGGRGLMLIRSVSDALEYNPTPEGQNRLTITVSRDATARVRMSDGARSGA